MFTRKKKEANVTGLPLPFINAVRVLPSLLKALISMFVLTSIVGCEQSEPESIAVDDIQVQAVVLKEAVPVKKRPNIILVMTDDQGYGDLGYHSNPIPQTPTIDELARQSVRFTNFHVDPTCAPTRAALMSGQYSLRAGVWHTVMGRHMLSDNHRILPEYLKDVGYATAMFGKWHLGDNYPFRPQDQGFDHVVMHGAGGVGQTPDTWGNTQFDDTYLYNGEEKKYKGYATDIWFDEAISFMEDKAADDAPYFLYLATNAPHAPFRVAEEYAKPYLDVGLPNLMALFYGMVTNIDDNMQRLLSALAATGQEENTIVIYMTDNGSSLPQLRGKEYKTLVDMLSDETRAHYGDALTTMNENMRGAKTSTYDGGHRVPFFIKWPGGGFDTPRDVTDLAAHIDVLPTLLDLVGVDTELDIDGVSLAPTLQQGEALPDRTLIVTNQRVLHPSSSRPYSVMRGQWRYVHADQDGGMELFDLSNDPGQTKNIAEQHPKRVEEMAAAYKDWWQHATAAGTPTVRPIIGSEAEPVMRLTGHDWLAQTTGQVAWWPGFGYNDDRWSKGWLNREERFKVAPWALSVDEPTKYQFEILLHDKPANKLIDKSYAHIELNGQVHTAKLADNAISATFLSQVAAGDLDVRAWFDDVADESGLATGLPAFFMYVEKAK